jgi:hypothetical protein
MLKVRICQKDPVLGFLGFQLHMEMPLPSFASPKAAAGLHCVNGQLDASMDWTAHFSETGA